MKRYKVLETIQDVNGTNWDAGSEISEKQITEEMATTLIADKKVELMDGDYHEETGEKLS